MYKTSLIYATDADDVVLDKAKSGVFAIDRMKDYTLNYRKAGGLASFADYYTARYDNAIMDNSLKKNIVFSNHNLVTDGVFGEMDMIICRNVFIYFNRDLQDRVFSMPVEGVVNYAHPSVDVVFESATEVYGQSLVGIILTGANNDGSQGLKKIKEAGGLAIVQSPETSEVADMSKAAIKPDYVLSLENIWSFLRKLESEG